MVNVAAPDHGAMPALVSLGRASARGATRARATQVWRVTPGTPDTRRNDCAA
jgi:hypothetical protein